MFLSLEMERFVIVRFVSYTDIAQQSSWQISLYYYIKERERERARKPRFQSDGNICTRTRTNQLDARAINIASDIKHGGRTIYAGLSSY